jgi:hypothetical protein
LESDPPKDVKAMPCTRAQALTASLAVFYVAVHAFYIFLFIRVDA